MSTKNRKTRQKPRTKNMPAGISPDEWFMRCLERAIENERKSLNEPSKGFNELALSWSREDGTNGILVSSDGFEITRCLVLNSRQWQLCRKAGWELEAEGLRTTDGRGVALLYAVKPDRAFHRKKS